MRGAAAETMAASFAGPSYGWEAGEKVLQRLNPPRSERDKTTRVAQEDPPPQPVSWRTARRQAVQTEIYAFLQAEEQRQQGIRKLLETIQVIDSLDTDFGSFKQFGRSLRTELDVLRSKLRATQKSFAKADGGFLRTFALARERRVADAVRWEGAGAFDDCDGQHQGADKSSPDENDRDRDLVACGAAAANRQRIEEEKRDHDMRIQNILDRDVMLNTDVEKLLEEAKAVKNATTNTTVNLTLTANDLHVRLETWKRNIDAVVEAITEDRETTYDLDNVSMGRNPQREALESPDAEPTQGSVEEYLAESKNQVDKLFGSMYHGRAVAMKFTEKLAEKSAHVTADLRSQNGILQQELLVMADKHEKHLKEKDLEVKKAEEGGARQCKALLEDHARELHETERKQEMLSRRYREQLEEVNRELCQEREDRANAEQRRQDVTAQLTELRARFESANQRLDHVLNERDKLLIQMEADKSGVAKLESLVAELQQQLDASGEGGETQIKVLQAQLAEARQKSLVEESKVVQLEGLIRNLEKDREKIRDPNSALSEGLAGFDTRVYDTTSTGEQDPRSAQTKNENARDGAKKQEQLLTRVAASEEVEMIETTQENKMLHAKLLAEEIIAEKARQLEQEKQELIEKVERFRSEIAEKSAAPAAALPLPLVPDINSAFITTMRAESEVEDAMCRQLREMEEQMYLMEERHQRELHDTRRREDHKLEELRLGSVLKSERVTLTRGLSHSDEKYDYIGSVDMKGALTSTEMTLQNADCIVLGNEYETRKHDEELKNAIQDRYDEAEVTDANTSNRMRFAVGLKHKPPAGHAHMQRRPKKEDWEPDCVRPMDRRTMLPAGKAPTHGWVPIARHGHRKRQMGQMPAMFVEEVAEALGGQHRLKTPSLPIKPAFAAKASPPSINFQSKNHPFFSGTDSSLPTGAQSEKRSQRQRQFVSDDNRVTGPMRPMTARARLQQACHSRPSSRLPREGIEMDLERLRLKQHDGCWSSAQWKHIYSSASSWPRPSTGNESERNDDKEDSNDKACSSTKTTLQDVSTPETGRRTYTNRPQQTPKRPMSAQVSSAPGLRQSRDRLVTPQRPASARIPRPASTRPPVSSWPFSARTPGEHFTTASLSGSSRKPRPKSARVPFSSDYLDACLSIHNVNSKTGQEQCGFNAPLLHVSPPTSSHTTSPAATVGAARSERGFMGSRPSSARRLCIQPVQPRHQTSSGLQGHKIVQLSREPVPGVLASSPRRFVDSRTNIATLQDNLLSASQRQRRQELTLSELGGWTTGTDALDSDVIDGIVSCYRLQVRPRPNAKFRPSRSGDPHHLSTADEIIFSYT